MGMPWAVTKGKLIATIKTDEGNLVIHSPKTSFATDTHLRCPLRARSGHTLLNDLVGLRQDRRGEFQYPVLSLFLHSRSFRVLSVVQSAIRLVLRPSDFVNIGGRRIDPLSLSSSSNHHLARTQVENKLPAPERKDYCVEYFDF